MTLILMIMIVPQGKKAVLIPLKLPLLPQILQQMDMIMVPTQVLVLYKEQWVVILILTWVWERSPDQQVPPVQGPTTSIVTFPLKDPLPNADFLIAIDGIGSILGSFDQKFEFANWGDIILFNPYAFCRGLSLLDFEAGDIHDPRSEDINGIINTITRGRFSFSVSNMMAKLEDTCYIHGQLPLPSLTRYLTTKVSFNAIK